MSLEQRARELLAAEYRADRYEDAAVRVEQGSLLHPADKAALRAIVAALTPKETPRNDRSDELAYEARLEYERRILEAECEGVRAEREMREKAAALCTTLADQSADMALYGEQEQARPRESMEATATRLRHMIEQIPLALGSEPDPAFATLSTPSPQGVERLREALEPFAREAAWMTEGYPDDARPDRSMSLTYADFRRAREALSSLTGDREG